MLRIYDDISDPDYQFGISRAHHHGHETASERIAMTGKTQTDDDISIKLNSTILSPLEDGQWYEKSSYFSNYYGATVNVTIYSGTTAVKNEEVYLPAVYLGTLSTAPSTSGIPRSGNTLTWNSDPNNSLGYIMLMYRLYDEFGTQIDIGAEMLEDDGSFIIDNLLQITTAKRISLILISGNTVSAVINGKKYLFSVGSFDFHEYRISN